MNCGYYCSNHWYPVWKDTRKRQTNEYEDMLFYISNYQCCSCCSPDMTPVPLAPKRKKTHPQVIGFPLWGECVPAPKDDPKRDALGIFWAMRTSLEHMPRLLRWFLWRWNTLKFWSGCGQKNWSHDSQCSYVTVWGKKRSPWSFWICSQGWRWVKSEKDLEGSLLPISRGGASSAVLPSACGL